jgi:hypothetical protein
MELRAAPKLISPHFLPGALSLAEHFGLTILLTSLFSPCTSVASSRLNPPPANQERPLHLALLWLLHLPPLHPVSLHSLHSLPPPPPCPPTMPRERGKPKRGARKNNALSRANRLTPSQRALIAHFAHPHRSTQSTQSALLQSLEVCKVKMETTSSTTHFPPSPPPALLYSPSIVKEEAPPLGKRIPLATNLLAPPVIKPGEPYYGDGSCQVEEEIPPSWQLENMAGTDKEIIAGGDDETGKEEEALPQHFSNHLAEEHLELLFEIRQRQDDQMHCQGVISQRMDIMFEALTDAPTQARCPTCRQRFTPAYTIHGQPSPAMD